MEENKQKLIENSSLGISKTEHEKEFIKKINNIENGMTSINNEIMDLNKQISTIMSKIIETKDSEERKDLQKIVGALQEERKALQKQVDGLREDKKVAFLESILNFE